MPNWQIAPIGLDAAADAFELFSRFFLEEGFGTPLDQMRQSVDAMIQGPGTVVFLAWLNSTAVAAATVRCTPSLEHGWYAEIEDLYVLPDQRGLGLARALVEACCDWCRAKGCTSVEVCITPEAEGAHGLSAFYTRLGFTDTGRSLWYRPLRG